MTKEKSEGYVCRGEKRGGKKERKEEIVWMKNKIKNK